jgi:hypothetical protein
LRDRDRDWSWVAVVDAGDQPAHKLANPVGLTIHALQDHGFDLHRDQAMPVAGFNRELADHELGPADQPRRGPRSLVRSGRPDCNAH